MLNSIVYFIVHVLIMSPLQAAIGERMAQAQVPAELARQVTACTAGAMPSLVQRIGDDPWWGVSTAVGIWTERTPAAEAVASVAPACRPAVDAVANYLGDRT